MDVFDKAKELGTMIAESGEMSELKASEAEIQADAHSQELLSEYKQLQLEVVKASKNKDKNSDEAKAAIESIKQKLLQKQEELNEYRVTRRYLEAKNDFDRLIKTVNSVISFAITGEEPCSSSNCSSCGGGCKH